jgi:hypothetical protein
MPWPNLPMMKLRARLIDTSESGASVNVLVVSEPGPKLRALTLYGTAGALLTGANQMMRPRVTRQNRIETLHANNLVARINGLHGELVRDANLSAVSGGDDESVLLPLELANNLANAASAPPAEFNLRWRPGYNEHQALLVAAAHEFGYDHIVQTLVAGRSMTGRDATLWKSQAAQLKSRFLRSREHIARLMIEAVAQATAGVSDLAA